MVEATNLKASEIARFLGARLFGDDVEIESVAPVDQFAAGVLSFAATYSAELEQALNSHERGFVIADDRYKGKLTCAHVISDAPRLDFLRVLRQFYAPPRPEGVHPTAIVHPEAQIGSGVFIGACSYVGPRVAIGDDSEIHHGVVIDGETRLGRRCVVKSNAVIGEEGFGFAFDEFGKPEHFPHIGRIEISDDVWIGACTTIERATIDVTLLESRVKVDDLVQIGHNCKVGRNTLVMAGSILCGGCVVMEGCWIAPNTLIREKVTVGANAYTGLGAVVISDVEENTVVVGNPAKLLRRRGS